MNDGSGVFLLWILAPLFVSTGLYLFWYSHRRKRMLEAFAKMHQFRIRPEFEEELQRTLDSCFTLKDEGLVRSFGQLSNPIDGESIWLSRAVELLDLNPYGQSHSTHFSRIVALFDISPDHDAFFVLDKSFHASQRLPGSQSPYPQVIEILKQTAKSCGARHSLSLTLPQGYGLIYFEPLVTGGETINVIDSLYCTAKNMAEKLYASARISA